MKTKQIISVAILLASMALFTSCATIISGQRQLVSFSTDPSGAEIILEKKVRGFPLEESIGITPLVAKIKRTSHRVKFQKEGYRDAVYYFNDKFNWWYMGNCILGGLPGMIVDLIVGSYQNIDYNVYQKLEKK